MKKIYLILLVILPCMLQSCLFEDKDLFDKTAAERMEEYLTEYKSLLVSSEKGWMLEYYPDENQSYGGFVYIVNFTDEDVIAYFELADDISVSVDSYYGLTTDDGPVLTFDAYNEYLHYFANPNINDYEAMHGDYEFNIAGKSDDESEIYLTGKKTGNHMVLKKMETPATEYLVKVNEISAAMSSPAYALSVGDIKAECKIVDNVLSYAYSTGGTAAEEGAAQTFSGNIPFCYTDYGVHFYEPVKIGDTVYDRMMFSEETLVSEDGKLVVSKVTPPINKWLVSGKWFISYDNLGPWAKPYFDRADSQLLASEGETLAFALLSKGNAVDSSYNADWGFTFVTDARYGGQLTMTTELIDEDQISMKFAMTGQGDGVYYHNNCGFNYYLNVFGYSSARTFTITTDNKENPTYLLLTDNANQNNWIRLTAQETPYK